MLTRAISVSLLLMETLWTGADIRLCSFAAQRKPMAKERMCICPVALYKLIVTEVLCKEDEAHAQQVISSSQRGAASSKKGAPRHCRNSPTRHF